MVCFCPLRNLAGGSGTVITALNALSGSAAGTSPRAAAGCEPGAALFPPGWPLPQAHAASAPQTARIKRKFLIFIGYSFSFPDRISLQPRRFLPELRVNYFPPAPQRLETF